MKTLSLETIQRFHNLNLDIKYTNELAASKTNDLVESCMKELTETHAKLDQVLKELADAKEEIEEQVDIIIKQKNELKKRR